MALFQHSVLNKYLQELDKLQIETAYNKFISHFGNKDIQENIRNAKEEEYQEGFIRDLFVEVLGYTLKPQPNFNIVLEKKNVNDAKKADGAIIKNDSVITVIELKGTDTVNLDSVEGQVFGYKYNQENCNYLITSNFEKLRLYIENAINYEEFDLFNLPKERFSLLFLCLSKNNLLNDIPLKIKQASITQEENITKKLYSDYSTFKHLIYSNIVELNPQYDKLLLYKKTQKLLDRFLFIFFAEDRLLLPPNSIREIIKQWEQLKELDNYLPLYDRFKKYFNYLYTGHQGKQHEIFAYNGGLFEPDEILDNIKIADDILFIHTQKLSDYNFETDVDVNILGHIFEHSLNEIEEVQAELEGQSIEKNKTRRKKDGIFYTPKYITKYIVENTLGVLCDEKKKELEIFDEIYSDAKKRSRKRLDNIKQYRDWLLQITICDPACGSGAFLNQALEFLINEHRYLDELSAKYSKDALVLSDIENSILENNLFGVDLNEESVDIAKLSLWLRTAHKGRKLTSLNKNIKCGNSLIDDSAVAGEKAFNWQNEFPDVFVNGGFDVIIGNPPYGAELSNKEWLKIKFKETSFGNIDSYKYFIQRGIEITKEKGMLSYIMPDSYLEKEYFKDLRLFTSSNFESIYNIKLGDDVFEEVNLPTAIIILQCKGHQAANYYYLDVSKVEKFQKQFKLFDLKNYNNGCPEVEQSFISINSIIKKGNTQPLIKAYNQVMGVKVYQIGKGKPKQTNVEIENNVFISNEKSEKFSFPFISQGIKRYFYEDQNEFISYGEWLAEPRELSFFVKPKIVVREIVNPTIFATYIEENAVVKNIAAIMTQKNDNFPLKYLLALMNSKLFNYYVDEQSPKSNNKSYPSFNSRLLKNLPIKECDLNIKNLLADKATLMLTKNQELQIIKIKFIKLLTSKYNDLKITNKLEDWTELDFKGFSKELEKQKIKLSLSEQSEWIEYFEKEKAKAQEIKSLIEKTDKVIDNMVYKLYELTEDEIKIVEGK